MHGERSRVAARPDLSFAFYVARERTMPTVYDSLLEYLRRDPSPPNVETWAQFERYLKSKGREDLEVGLRLWRCYQQWFRDRSMGCVRR
ncbi:hypothetical protein VI08_09305 [Luteibacter yeojuensis]|uniref:YozE SAM-like domain-containing protein n=1 Tax=Luteibacter yeojuensis TaxID=345309 RepID=A0A0F3KU30_9GAMM|nr:hypothetical protein VI08_09305 [Luteibacter yeojuensis]